MCQDINAQTFHFLTTVICILTVLMCSKDYFSNRFPLLFSQQLDQIDLKGMAETIASTPFTPVTATPFHLYLILVSLQFELSR